MTQKVCFAIGFLFVAGGATWVLWRNLAAGNDTNPSQAPPECTEVANESGERPSGPKIENRVHQSKPKKQKLDRRLRLAEGISLELVPIEIEKNEGPFASVSVISNEQYRLAVEAGAVAAPLLPVELRKTLCANVAWGKGVYPEGQKEDAVLFVNLNEATSYCAWLGERFTQYDFKLPDSSECYLIGEQGQPSFVGRHPDSFPRPVRGSGRLDAKKAFWLAPTTLELVKGEEPYSAAELERWKLLSARYGDGSFTSLGRYRECGTGAPGGPTVTPTAFRVVAVTKRQK